MALKNGLLLVDTKYEFGVDEEGNILLIDEVRLQPFARDRSVRPRVLSLSRPDDNGG